MIDYEKIDPECRELVRAMNRFDGVRTLDSCCGHGEPHYAIHFLADIETLPDMLYWIDGCHTGVYGWRVEVYTDCGVCPARFRLTTDKRGKQAYDDAVVIAERMKRATDEE